MQRAEASVWAYLREQIEADRSAALLTVTRSTGSAPGKIGFKMALSPGQAPFGTVGGGVMEFQLVEQIYAHLEQGLPWTEHLERIHLDNAPESVQSGMICAGGQWIAVHIIQPQDHAVIQRLAQDSAEGTLFLGPKGLGFKESGSRPPWDADEIWYEELLGARERVSIIGGGHVGLALSKVLALLDFDIHVYDHRPEVNTFTRVACPKTVADYHQLGALIPGGRHSYGVIVTTGFKSDAEALYQLIGKDLGYLGLMGSAAKIERIFQTLSQRGVDPQLLKRVRAPIGVPIHNETPAEIAVSIAAELINTRNGGAGRMG